MLMKTLMPAVCNHHNHYNWLEWILAGRLYDDPICCPKSKPVYKSTFDLSRYGHKARINPSSTEAKYYKIPTGLSIIANNVFENEEGEWIEVHEQSRMQFGIKSDVAVYVCVRQAGQSPLYSKINREWVNLFHSIPFRY